MWLLLDQRSTRDGLEAVLPGVEALVQFAAELGQRLRGVEVEGVAGALGLSRRLHAVLDGIAVDDLERALAVTAALERVLRDCVDRLDALRAFKAQLEEGDPTA